MASVSASLVAWQMEGRGAEKWAVENGSPIEQAAEGFLPIALGPTLRQSFTVARSPCVMVANQHLDQEEARQMWAGADTGSSFSTKLKSVHSVESLIACNE